MRTDAIIDRRSVHCPHADCTGFGKWQARLGDLVWFTEDGTASSEHVGRMIGRIHYAPALEPGEQPIRDWLLVAVLSHNLSYVYERWIDPAKVTKCESRDDQKRVAAVKWFLSDDLTKQPLDMVRECISYLWSSFDDFLKYEVTHNRPVDQTVDSLVDPTGKDGR